MEINSLEKVQVNGSAQWLLVRGKKAHAPLMIQVQAGPGLPMISEANALNRLFNWEDDYVVAYWDQRGCGKSFNKSLDPEAITLDQLTDDLLTVASHLVKKYRKQKALLVGYSIGATISLLAAAKHSSLFDAVFVVGVDIDLPYANRFALDFAREKAIEKNKKNLLLKIDKLSALPIATSKLFQARAKIITDLGGIILNSSYNQVFVNTLRNLLTCKHYSFLDVIKAIQGMEFCQNALLTEMNQLNLFERQLQIDVPLHFLQGVNDGVAPLAVAKKYFEDVSAREKTFTVFEHSAHLPQFDEPKKFYECIKLIHTSGVGSSESN